MKKNAITLLIFLSMTSSAMAAFQGPSASEVITTVAQALAAKDDQAVSLTGHIIASYGNEEYQFQDSSGTIRIELDDDNWGDVDATPETKVVIHGEVDRYMERIEIDVDRIQIAP